METSRPNGYVCPYCRRNASTQWATVVKEKELIDSSYVGTDFGHHLYHDKYHLYNVRKCARCDHSKKLKMRFIRCVGWGTLACCVAGMLLIIMGVFINIFPKTLCTAGLWMLVGGVVAGTTLFIAYLIWCICSRCRLTVSYSRAKECDALA